MGINDSEKQSISIALIDDNQQHVKEKIHSYSHRYKTLCTEKYLIGVAIPILFVTILIILIVLFRESGRRCGLFSSPYQCEQMRNHSHQFKKHFNY